MQFQTAHAYTASLFDIVLGLRLQAVDLITQRVVVVKENEKPHLLEQELSCAP